MALVDVLVWKFVIEDVLLIVTGNPGVRRWMPPSAADAVLYGRDGTGLLQPLPGGVLFAG